MERTENFNITLDSHNTKFKSQNYNNSDFKVIIPNGITLNGDTNWEVGLVDAIIPNKAFNISEHNDTFYFLIRNPRYPFTRLGYTTFIDVDFYVSNFFSTTPGFIDYNYRQQLYKAYKRAFPDTVNRCGYLGIQGPRIHNATQKYYNNACTALPFKIERGVYDDYKILCQLMWVSWTKALQSTMKTLKRNLWSHYTDWCEGIYLSWDTSKRSDDDYLRLTSNTKGNLGLAIPALLGDMLGIDTNQELIYICRIPYYFVFPESKCFVHKPYLYLGLTNLYVYTNIIDFSIVGSGQSQLLRHFTYNQAPGVANNIGVQFKHVHYLPITDKRINDIYIFIRNELGDPVHLVGGDCIVRLEFRRVPR